MTIMPRTTTTTTTRSNVIYQVVSLNNHGVGLLGNRNFEGARQVFYQAIAQMREADDLEQQQREQCVVESGAPPPPPDHQHHYYPPSPGGGSPPPNTPDAASSMDVDDSQHTSSEFPSFERYVFSSGSCMATGATGDHSTFISHHGSSQQPPPSSPFSPPPKTAAPAVVSTEDTAALYYYSFLRPILLSEENYADASLNSPLATQLVVCLLFNLAVMNHSKVLFGGFSSSLSSPSAGATTRTSTITEGDDYREMSLALQDAITLYRTAYTLQETQMVELSRLHTLGMINNMGQLFYQAGMDDDSRTCFELLLQKMITDQQQQPDPTGWLVLDPWARPPANVGDDYGSLQEPYVKLFQDNIHVALVGRYGCFHSPAA
jgi:hypothetical protein